MRAKPKQTAFVTCFFLFLALVSQANASFFFESGVHVAFHDSADLIMGEDFTFNTDTITYGNGSINIGGAWLNSTVDMNLTIYFQAGWFNYTVTENGTQTLYNSTHRPVEVRLDGLNTKENSGWTYNNVTNALTVYNASSTVSLYFMPLTLGDPYFIVTVSLVVSGTAGALIYFYRRSVKKRSKEIT